MESIITPKGTQYATVGVVGEQLKIRFSNTGATVIMDRKVVPQLAEILINILKETNVRDLV